MMTFQKMKGTVAMGIAAGAAVLAGAAAVAGAPDVKAPPYTVQRATVPPALDGSWEGAVWNSVPALDVAHFYRTDVSGHRPRTQAKVLYDDKGLYVHFRVEDQYVRSVETKYHGRVWEDACVEFFVAPKPGRGYFNFEINCGGTMLLSYDEDPNWKGDTLRTSESVPWDLARKVKIFHTLPETVDPEIADPVVWNVEYFIPYEIFSAYLGDLGDVSGQTWRANFYKCAETNSHPHWASWSLITADLNFHLPEFFSEIHFAK